MIIWQQFITLIISPYCTYCANIYSIKKFTFKSEYQYNHTYHASLTQIFFNYIK